MVKCSAVFACACALLPAALSGQLNVHPVLAKDVLPTAELLAKREKRLRDGPVIKLYHQTNEWACKAIMNSTFYPGKGGIAGGGIYFAFSAFDTQWKAQTWGCMIAAWVAIGRSKNLTYNGNPHLTAKKMLHDEHDSVWIPRGCDGPPCQPPPQPEQAIYFSDQILQMTAYPCYRNGKGKSASMYYAKALSDLPPLFNHSDGLSQAEIYKIDVIAGLEAESGSRLNGRMSNLVEFWMKWTNVSKSGPMWAFVLAAMIAGVVVLCPVFLCTLCRSHLLLFALKREKQTACDKPVRLLTVDALDRMSTSSSDDEDPRTLALFASS